MADDRWDDLENALPRLLVSNPDVAKGVKAVKPMGWFEKLIGGNKNIATTDLDGTIHYNKAAAMRDKTDPNVLLAHELEHVRQNQSRGVLPNIYQRFKQGMLPWESRPDEIAAMAREYPVRGFERTGDIELKPETVGPASLRAVTRLAK